MTHTSPAQLEGQMNALAQAWLHLAAELELQGAIDAPRLEQALRHRRWPDNPQVNREGRETLRWLCDQLADARSHRQSPAQRG